MGGGVVAGCAGHRRGADAPARHPGQGAGMSAPDGDAVIEWLAQQARELREARQARDILVYMLGLEPVAGRLGGRATWDDVVDYVAKVQGSRDLAMDTVRRRQHLLAAALD